MTWQQHSNGLILPKPKPPEPTAEEERQAFMREYREAHAVCPQCGNGTEETTVGYLGWGPGFRDMNRATCSCGWQGNVHDRVPEGDS